MWILIELRPFYISDIGFMIQRKAQDPDFQLIIIIRGNVLSIGDLYWAKIKRKTIHLNFFWLCKNIHLFINSYFLFILFLHSFLIHSYPSFYFFIFFSFFFIFYIFFKIILKGDFLASYISYGRTNPTYVIISRGEAAEGTGVPRCTTGTMQAVRIRETQENWTHPPVSGKIACWRPGTGNQSLRPLLAGHCLYFLSFLSVLFL